MMFRRDSAGLSAPVAVCSSKTTQNLPKSIKIHQNPYCSRIRKLYPKSRKFRKFKIASVRAEYMRASGPLFCASMASMDSLLVLLQTHSPETTPNPSYQHRFGAKNPKTDVFLRGWWNRDENSPADGGKLWSFSGENFPVFSPRRLLLMWEVFF